MKLPSFLDRFRKKSAKEDASGEDESAEDAPGEDAPGEDALAADDASDAPSDDEAARKIPFRVRFRAWWDGVAVDDVLAREAAREILSGEDEELEFGEEGAASEETPKLSRYTGLWTPVRIQVAEKVWGEGFISPGDADYVLDMIKPLAINPKMSLLDLGAGLGGPARTFAEKFNLSVTAMEPCAELAEAGMAEATKHGMAKRAPIEVCNPDNIEIKEKGFDCIVSKELFFLVSNKSHLIKAVRDALKSRGQFLFTDYVLTTTDKVSTETNNWMVSEPLRPDLWSVKQYRDYLSLLKFDIRIEEDITTDYCKRLINHWRGFLKHLRPGQFKEEMAGALVREAEIWFHRNKVLSQGEVKVYRFHAMRPN